VTAHGLVIVDVETTGLEPHDICVEVGWHDLRTGEHGGFVPAHDVAWVLDNAHPRALEVNGYRERLVDAKQDDGYEVHRLHHRLRGQSLGGSNVRTDAAHMARLFADEDLAREPWHYHLAELSSYACGVLGIPITDPPGLWSCCELLGVEPEGDVHTAEGGASATARCFTALMAKTTAPTSTEGAAT
jgi:DNA polymerase-3 subunit epsilon